MQFRHLLAMASLGIAGFVGLGLPCKALGSEPERKASLTSEEGDRGTPDDSADEADTSTEEATEELNALAAGFGCHGPFRSNEYECNRHCRRNRFRGGYCNAATGWLRCDCYR